jgi:hypothetical protein
VLVLRGSVCQSHACAHPRAGSWYNTPQLLPEPYVCTSLGSAQIINYGFMSGHAKEAPTENTPAATLPMSSEPLRQVGKQFRLLESWQTHNERHISLWL